MPTDPKNQIVIISGRSKDFLEKQFMGVNVTLVAEHGYFIKRTGKKLGSQHSNLIYNGKKPLCQFLSNMSGDAMEHLSRKKQAVLPGIIEMPILILPNCVFMNYVMILSKLSVIKPISKFLKEQSAGSKKWQI